jgi:hypothetical protein
MMRPYGAADRNGRAFDPAQASSVSETGRVQRTRKYSIYLRGEHGVYLACAS